MTSFAQQRLWMDEKVRFDDMINGQTAVYNEILIYKLSSNTTFSTNQLRQALALIINKHTILRTALIYNQDRIIQKVLPMSSDIYNFEVTNVTDNNHLHKIIDDEVTNRSLFDLEQGHVFRCHILRYLSNDEDKSILKHNDMVLFNFHHTAIDGTAINIFINDLRQALRTKQLSYNNEDNITYLDYAQYERLEDWTNAQQYWTNVLKTVDNSVDRHNSPIRTGKGYTVTLDLDHDLAINLNRFIYQSNSTLFQIGLAAFFAFLFKMSNSEQFDMCTGIVVANRSQYQLQSMIGFFSNTLPFRLKIDPYESFAQLCHRIQQFWLDILPHSHLPYQEIIKLNPNLGSTFLRTLFLVETTMNSSEQNIEFDEKTTLNIVDRNLLAGNIAKFDITCTVRENRQNESVSVSLNASTDVYDESTISAMASRLKIVFEQLFSISCIYQFSLLLPHEVGLVRDLNDTFFDYGQIGCIHWDFANQAYMHPQKMALVLEHGSMTYSELFYYSQQLAGHLITRCGVQPRQTICQLVERSFEMVIGMIGIWMSGCVYTPLNLYDPLTQLNACIEQTDAHLVLVHQSTYDQSLFECLMISVDEVIYFSQINEELTTCIDSINVTPEHISHIIFANDFSGLLKVVSK
jgi:hypothetical protein